MDVFEVALREKARTTLDASVSACLLAVADVIKSVDEAHKQVVVAPTKPAVVESTKPAVV